MILSAFVAVTGRPVRGLCDLVREIVRDRCVHVTMQVHGKALVAALDHFAADGALGRV